MSSDRVSPDPEKTEAISKFPVPKNVKDVRSFLGLANQLSEYSKDLASLSTQLRGLLRKNANFKWTDVHMEAFNDVKTELLKSPVLGLFDTSLETVLLTDASNLNGLGYALMQRRPNGKIALIRCGSRSITPTEGRYAPI